MPNQDEFYRGMHKTRLVKFFSSSTNEGGKEIKSFFSLSFLFLSIFFHKVSSYELGGPARQRLDFLFRGHVIVVTGAPGLK